MFLFVTRHFFKGESFVIVCPVVKKTPQFAALRHCHIHQAGIELDGAGELWDFMMY